MERGYPNDTSTEVFRWWEGIVSVVRSLYNVTVSLYDIIKKTQPKASREDQINQITKLLNEREQLIYQLKPPYSVEEGELGKKIVQLNAVINQQLKELMQHIQLDIKQFKNTKAKTKKYTNPYESVSFDGMFFDKRN